MLSGSARGVTAPRRKEIRRIEVQRCRREKENCKPACAVDAGIAVSAGRFCADGAFVLYPLVRNIWISFTDFKVIQNRPNAWVGLRNYLSLLSDQNYRIAFRNTILYALVTVPGQMACGLVLACLVNSVRRGQTAFKVICYLPVITSWVVVSMVFKYLFMSGKGGMVNYILMQLHLVESPVSWLQHTWTANLVLWLFGIWKGTGWVMVIYMAALQGIPQEIYEAAELDGANGIRRFFAITLPMVRNTTNYLLTVLTIGAFGAYIHVMMITDGAPLGTTNELMNYMYNTAFSTFDFGSAAAQAVLMGVIVLLLTLLQRRVSRGSDRVKERRYETYYDFSPQISGADMLCVGGADPVSVYAGNGHDAVQLLHAVSAHPVPGNDVWGKFCGSVECQSFQSVLSEQSYHCGSGHGGDHAGVLCRGICLCADEISRQGCPVLSVPVFHDGADGNEPDPAVPLMKDMKLVDSYLGLLLIYIGIGVPQNTFFLRNFFLGLPKELEEAVIIDGGNRWQIYWKMVLPLSKPALGTFAILAYSNVWDEFLIALTMIKTPEKRTLPIALRLFQGQNLNNWGLIFAASLIAVVPILLIYIVMQKKLIHGGAMDGMLKG